MARPGGLNPGRDPARRATIHDVAAAAGVSRQSVTRAVNDLPGIGPETKRRVLEAAARLHYRPSRFGRGLVSGGPRSLGLVVGDLTNPYYPELAAAVVGLAAEHGWNVLLADLAHVGDVSLQVRELTRQVDAVVGYLGRLDADARGALSRLPVVDIGDAPARPDALPSGHGAVGLSMRLGVEQAVDHLSRAGARRPVMLDRTPPRLGDDLGHDVAGVAAENAISSRAELYRAGWRDRGIELVVIGAENDDVAGGDRSMGLALERHPDLDAVCCYNDRTAFGALAALRRAGIDVPGRVRVVGLDGLSIGALVTPSLTTLALDMTEVARSAMDLVLELAGAGSADGAARVESDTHGPRRYVSHRLLVRESA